MPTTNTALDLMSLSISAFTSSFDNTFNLAAEYFLSLTIYNSYPLYIILLRSIFYLWQYIIIHRLPLTVHNLVEYPDYFPFCHLRSPPRNAFPPRWINEEGEEKQETYLLLEGCQISFATPSCWASKLRLGTMLM